MGEVTKTAVGTDHRCGQCGVFSSTGLDTKLVLRQRWGFGQGGATRVSPDRTSCVLGKGGKVMMHEGATRVMAKGSSLPCFPQTCRAATITRIFQAQQRRGTGC